MVVAHESKVAIVGANETKLPITCYMADLFWLLCIWIRNVGEKKDFYIKIFFFTNFFVPKILKNFGMRKTWWKKRLIIENLFFHQFLRQEQKIFHSWRKTWWKKRFSKGDLFFHQLFCQEWKNFWTLTWILVKKKIFI